MYRFQGSHIARSEVCLIADDLFIIPNVACFVNTFFEFFYLFEPVAALGSAGFSGRLYHFSYNLKDSVGILFKTAGTLDRRGFFMYNEPCGVCRYLTGAVEDNIGNNRESPRRKEISRAAEM